MEEDGSPPGKRQAVGDVNEEAKRMEEIEEEMRNVQISRTLYDAFRELGIKIIESPYGYVLPENVQEARRALNAQHHGRGDILGSVEMEHVSVLGRWQINAKACEIIANTILTQSGKLYFFDMHEHDGSDGFQLTAFATNKINKNGELEFTLWFHDRRFIPELFTQNIVTQDTTNGQVFTIKFLTAEFPLLEELMARWLLTYAKTGTCFYRQLSRMHDDFIYAWLDKDITTLRMFLFFSKKVVRKADSIHIIREELVEFKRFASNNVNITRSIDDLHVLGRYGIDSERTYVTLLSVRQTLRKIYISSGIMSDPEPKEKGKTHLEFAIVPPWEYEGAASRLYPQLEDRPSTRNRTAPKFLEGDDYDLSFIHKLIRGKPGETIFKKNKKYRRVDRTNYFTRILEYEWREENVLETSTEPDGYKTIRFHAISDHVEYWLGFVVSYFVHICYYINSVPEDDTFSRVFKEMITGVEFERIFDEIELEAKNELKINELDVEKNPITKAMRKHSKDIFVNFIKDAGNKIALRKIGEPTGLPPALLETKLIYYYLAAEIETVMRENIRTIALSRAYLLR